MLVWCGRKPASRFCATREDLASNPYFPNGSHHAGLGSLHSNPYEDFVSKSRVIDSNAPDSSFVQIGEVLEIRQNGAVVGMGKDTKNRAFIQGWLHTNVQIPGKKFLTTFQGVELAPGDLVMSPFILSMLFTS